MNPSYHLYICELEECELILERPITLPCGSTICQEHVKTCQNKYDCVLCNEEHLIPVNGFPLNKFAIKTIQNGLNLDEIQKRINYLETIIKEHESLNSDNLICDYFSNLKNEVNLYREQLIEQNNKRSEEIIKQLEQMEENCKVNSSKLEKMNLDKFKNEEMIDFKYQLRKPDFNKLCSFVNDKIDDIQDDINNFKNESLMKKTIKFNKQNNDTFGELKVEEIANESNRSQGSLKLVINEFSKFKEGKESCRRSEPFILRNLEWLIEVNLTTLKDGSFGFGFYFRCDDKHVTLSEKYAILAESKLKIIHLRDQEKNKVRCNKTIKIKLLNFLFKLNYFNISSIPTSLFKQ